MRLQREQASSSSEEAREVSAARIPDVAAIALGAVLAAWGSFGLTE
jgi:hypothetical protein